MCHRLDCQKHSAVCGGCTEGYRPLTPNTWTLPRPCPLCQYSDNEEDSKLLNRYKVTGHCIGFCIKGRIQFSIDDEGRKNRRFQSFSFFIETFHSTPSEVNHLEFLFCAGHLNLSFVQCIASYWIVVKV